MSGRILLVEDRADAREHFSALLEEAGYAVAAFAEARPALAHLETLGDRVDCLVTDFQLPDLDGLEILRRCQETAPRLPVVFVTGMGGTQIAIEAMKHGAFDYLEKPVDDGELLRVVRTAVDRREASSAVQSIAVSEAPEEMIVGRSAAMLSVYKQIGRVAAMATPVLIVGDSGTGKELVARAIHDNSAAAEVGFFAINCAAIPETLLESELFGYEKGAFTGASEMRRGLFEAAGGGTVFLDEIGDMPRLLQGKLLRVLQQKTIQRLGSHREHPVAFRLIAATHQNLEKMVAEGSFRQDLYHRLAGLKLRLPRLADRPEDIALLANYFLQLYAFEFQLAHAAIEREAIELLQRQPWPGNVRQLQNVIRTALLHSRNLGVNRRAIEEALAQSDRADAPAAASGGALEDWMQARLAGVDWETAEGLYDGLLAEFERALLTRTGAALDHNRTRMAAALGMSRLTLRRKLAGAVGKAEG